MKLPSLLCRMAALVAGWSMTAAFAADLQTYSDDDFARVEKIDTHVHVHGAVPAFMSRVAADGVRLLTINVNYSGAPPLSKQFNDALALQRAYPDRIAFVTTFDAADSTSPDWAARTERQIQGALDKGAVGVKVWKDVGMQYRDPSGRAVMIDDARFTPIFRFLEKRNVVLLGHQGEPRSAWQPLQEMTLRGDREYFAAHPQYHMFAHPEWPSYEQQLAARDRMLDRHPGLRFVGVHLASLEWDVERLAKFLRRYPRASVDLAERLVHLKQQASKDREKVRQFFITFQDRILYGTDLSNEVDGIDKSDADLAAEAHKVWLDDWRFLTGDASMSSVGFDAPFRGLALPRTVIDRVYHGNARQLFPTAWRTSGVDPARLARLDQVLQQYVDEGRIAGAVALVMQDGRPVYERAVGWSDKEAGIRMQSDTLFRIASQTKAITSVAILSLLEEGKLVLNDRAAKFIPQFAHTTVAMQENGKQNIVPAKRAITIRDLLTHTAGISYGTEPQVAALYGAQGLGPAAGRGWYVADKNEPICTTMERLATLPFVAQPGEAYVYGYNTDVLGCIVERAAGVSLDEFVRARITGPLGMKDTYFYLPSDQRRRLAAVYSSGPDGKIVRAPQGAIGQGHYVDGPRRSFSGGAGLVSTAVDYARFLEMIRNGGALGGVRILSPRAVALMSTNMVGELHARDARTVGLSARDGLGFGLGFQTVERYGANGMEGQGAFGWGGAYGTLGRVDPGVGLTMLFMVQLVPNQTDIREKFPNMVYQALMERGASSEH